LSVVIPRSEAWLYHRPAFSTHYGQLPPEVWTPELVRSKLQVTDASDIMRTMLACIFCLLICTYVDVCVFTSL